MRVAQKKGTILHQAPQITLFLTHPVDSYFIETSITIKIVKFHISTSFWISLC